MVSHSVHFGELILNMKREISFTKMQGTGNDFVVVDNRTHNFSKKTWIELTPELCDRKFGIGADGLLVLTEDDENKADYEMIYRNADGSDAGMCGNGGRCIALFAAKNGFQDQHTFRVHNSIYEADVDPESYQVAITFPHEVTLESRSGDRFSDLDYCYSGTDHVVIFDDKLEDRERIKQIAQEIRNNSQLFPKGTNVNFYHPKDEHSLQLLTYERGVEDFTLACGTGALATAITAHHNNVISSNTIAVQVDGGKLDISFSVTSGVYSGLTLAGPAAIVFNGTIKI